MLLVALLLVATAAIPAAAAADPGGYDAANEADEAYTLPPGTYSASLHDSSDEDWYRLIAPMLTKVTVTVEPVCPNADGDPVDADLELYQGDGTSLITASTGSACETETVQCWANMNQQLFTRVWTPNAQPGDYKITHTQTTAIGQPATPTPFCTVN